MNNAPCPDLPTSPVPEGAGAPSSQPERIVFRAVLWDVDGTLADSEPLHQRTLSAVLASVGSVANEALFDETVGLAGLQVHALCAERFGLSMPIEDWSAFRQAAYQHEARTLLPRPGALEAFHLLAERGIVQAVVSNSARAVLDMSLRALQMHEQLHQPAVLSVSSSDVRHGKPDPESYLRAARLLGVSPQHALVVEDSPVGATAGVAAGMQVLAWPAPDIPTGAFPASCHFVHSAAALTEFLLFHTGQDSDAA